MRYRRVLIPGGTYFFTLAIVQRNSALLTSNITLLRSAYKSVAKSHPFKTLAIVILPDHLHAIWQLPVGDCDYAKRWRLIKSNFSRQLNNYEHKSPSRILKCERGIWQRRYWEHYIKDEQDLMNHINYIYFNPVKHKYVNQIEDWPFSSYRKLSESSAFNLSDDELDIALNLYED